MVSVIRMEKKYWLALRVIILALLVTRQVATTDESDGAAKQVLTEPAELEVNITPLPPSEEPGKRTNNHDGQLKKVEEILSSSRCVQNRKLSSGGGRFGSFHYPYELMYQSLNYDLPCKSDYSEEGHERRAEVFIKGIEGTGVYGYMTFYQYDSLSPLLIIGDVYGLEVGGHGIHVHNGTESGNECSHVGVHFDPYSGGPYTHGGPYDRIRHAGDLGNLDSESMEEGCHKTRAHLLLAIEDGRTTLYGKNTIIGRSLVVHEDMDDFGRGPAPQSLINGNSGAPIACGIIHWRHLEAY